jgi:hypothetical protein
MSMKGMLKTLCAVSGVLICLGCATLDRYKQADQYKYQVHSLAVLPLILGDDDGRLQKSGNTEVYEFKDYFDRTFYDSFEKSVQLIDSIQLKLPGRDFNINVYNGMDYFAAARELGVDAVLGINLTLYNEVKPGAKGAQVAAAVLTTVLLGGYVKENQIVGYDTHYAYLNVEKVDESLSFRYAGKAFPTIEEQREYFLGSLLGHLDTQFPLSTDYVPAYKE